MLGRNGIGEADVMNLPGKIHSRAVRLLLKGCILRSRSWRSEYFVLLLYLPCRGFMVLAIGLMLSRIEALRHKLKEQGKHMAELDKHL